MLLYPTLIGQEATPVLLCSEHSSSLPPLGRGQDAVCLERLAGPWAISEWGRGSWANHLYQEGRELRRPHGLGTREMVIPWV